jgi:hypothetical protein
LVVSFVELGSVTVQIVCDWVKKFNAHGPEGLINRKAPGKPPTLHDLAAAICELGWRQSAEP